MAVIKAPVMWLLLSIGRQNHLCSTSSHRPDAVVFFLCRMVDTPCCRGNTPGVLYSLFYLLKDAWPEPELVVDASHNGVESEASFKHHVTSLQ